VILPSVDNTPLAAVTIGRAGLSTGPGQAEPSGGLQPKERSGISARQYGSAQRRRQDDSRRTSQREENFGIFSANPLKHFSRSSSSLT
jgi:hypothetical protein